MEKIPFKNLKDQNSTNLFLSLNLKTVDFLIISHGRQQIKSHS